jgi:hypothetical protein
VYLRESTSAGVYRMTCRMNDCKFRASAHRQARVLGSSKALFRLYSGPIYKGSFQAQDSAAACGRVEVPGTR